ncbi:hypothetical protein [Sphingomonas sp.]|uniref:hypothetical protein n=1 Tax=Sphingomonas sp. TaxID=28214 RepID=UPI003CC5BAB2
MSEAASVRDFISDPVEYFDWSATRMWSMPQADRESMQLAGLKIRFGQLRDGVGYLQKLADRQGIDEINSVNAVIPLLFEHTVYKSYPSSLLEKSRFSMINGWLGKLTTVSLKNVDVSHCDSIDSWIETMDRETDLCIHHSSGTSGTVSLFPKSKQELSAFGKLYPLRFQRFRDPRPADPQPKAHVVSPSFRSGSSAHFRINEQYFQRIAHGDETFMHTAFPGAMSADILYLAGRLRAAKARGDLDRLEIAPNLLARLHEFETDQASRAADMQTFLDHITSSLAGQRVFMACAPTYLWPLAQKGLAEGRSGVFAPTSVVSTGGGAKGMVLPDDWKVKVMEFAGVDHLPMNYAMTEMNANNLLCENNKYHVAPWIIPFVLDPDTSEPLPRTGTATGRFAFYDLLPDTHWGGFISGDEVTISWDRECGCGRSGPYLNGTIGRFSDSRGGDDKISCAASAEAHEEAMDFLSEIQAAATA